VTNSEHELKSSHCVSGGRSRTVTFNDGPVLPRAQVTAAEDGAAVADPALAGNEKHGVPEFDSIAGHRRFESPLDQDEVGVEQEGADKASEMAGVRVGRAICSSTGRRVSSRTGGAWSYTSG
jgi:hypothetical protein